MKRFALLVLAMSVLAAGLFVVNARAGCSEWQERYKRAQYSELMKITPFVYTPAELEKIAGERPLGCDRPPRNLSESDLSRILAGYERMNRQIGLGR